MSLLALLLVASLLLALRLSMAEPSKEEMAALMAKFKAAAEPAEPHAWLATLAGEWTLETTSLMQGGSKTHGKVSAKMIQGGRFLQEELTSEWMGGTITRLQHIGYDTVQAKYLFTAVTSNSTTTYFGQGTRDETTGALTILTPIHDPITPEGRISRTVVTYPSPDEQLIQVHDTKDGREILVVEMTMRRSGT